jgi:hypothetical protein
VNRRPPRKITGAGRPCVRDCTLDSAAHVKPEHATGAVVRGRPWKADGAHRPSRRPDAVRYMSVDTATQRNKVTHGGTEKKRPA